MGRNGGSGRGRFRFGVWVHGASISFPPSAWIWNGAGYTKRMKMPVHVYLAAALFLAGCGDHSSKTAQTTNSTSGSSGNPLTAPVDYLGALGNAQKLAVKTVDTASLNQAIQMF